jgi:hypothetical protein
MTRSVKKSRRTGVTTEAEKKRQLSDRRYRAAEKRTQSGDCVEMQDRWIEFEEGLNAEIKFLALNPGQRSSRCYEPENYLKQEVYRFVWDCLARGDGPQLQVVLSVASSLLWERKKASFRINPFNWVLLALRDPTRDVQSVSDGGSGTKRKNVDRDPDHITADMVWKYSRLLHYAWRHQVPPDLVVGFLYQSGTEAHIAKRASDYKKVEKWFSKRREHDQIIQAMNLVGLRALKSSYQALDNESRVSSGASFSGIVKWFGRRIARLDQG